MGGNNYLLYREGNRPSVFWTRSRNAPRSRCRARPTSATCTGIREEPFGGLDPHAGQIFGRGRSPIRLNVRCRSNRLTWSSATIERQCVGIMGGSDSAMASTIFVRLPQAVGLLTLARPERPRRRVDGADIRSLALSASLDLHDGRQKIRVVYADKTCILPGVAIKTMADHFASDNISAPTFRRLPYRSRPCSSRAGYVRHSGSARPHVAHLQSEVYPLAARM